MRLARVWGSGTAALVALLLVRLRQATGRARRA